MSMTDSRPLGWIFWGLAVTLAAFLTVFFSAGCGGPSSERERPWDGGSPPDDATVPMAFTGVADKLLLPGSSSDYAFDLDGNGTKDNQIGRMLVALEQVYPRLELQTKLDQQIARGQLILLQEILAGSLTDAAAVTARVMLGQDTDGDPTDNFSGTETLAPAGDVPQGLLTGQITGGHLSTQPGEQWFPLPLGRAVTMVPCRRARIQADLGEGRLSAGVLAGAIPTEEIAARVLPVLANELNLQYQDPQVTPKGRQTLAQLFDLDGDGIITGAEVASCPTVGVLLGTADVDTDGDGEPDAMSMGIGFTAVRAKILGTEVE